MTIEWNEVRWFKPDEFPEDPDECARPSLIYGLDEFRDILGRIVYPSPAAGALARNSEGSQHHYNGMTRSNAVDVFPEGPAANAWQVAVTCQLWGAVGLYPHTEYGGQAWPMLHLDRRRLGEDHWRPTMLLWVRKATGEYVYPQYMTGGMEYLFNLLRRLS